MSAQSSKVILAAVAAARASAQAQLALAEALEEELARADDGSAVVPSAPSSRSRVRRARPVERPAGESDDLAAARARKILKGHNFIARAR